MDHPSFIHHPSRLITYKFWGQPSHPCVTRNVMLDAEWTGAVARGEVQGLKRYDLNKFDPDDLDDKKHRAIAQDYSLIFEDEGNRIDNWGQDIGEVEKTARVAALKGYREELVELELKQTNQRAQGGDLDDSEKARLFELKKIITEFEKYGHLRAVPNGFGDGTSTLYDRLSSANVPRRRYSIKKVGQDAPFSVRCYIWRPPDDQAYYYYRIEWSWWRFEIGMDRRARIYRLNHELTPEEFAAKELELEQLLDQGRLTVQDRRDEKAQKNEIKGLQKQAKDAGGDDQKALEKKIKELETKIDKRRRDKRKLTAEQEKDVAKLKKELYIASGDINFGQNAEDFFNQPLTFTFLPQRRGFLTIVLEGCEPFCFEDKTITQRRAYDTVWEASKVYIAHNGGSTKWQLGYPQPVEYGRLQLQRASFGFGLAPGEFFTVNGSDGDIGPGSNVDFLYNKVDGSGQTIGSVTYPPEYDFDIVWTGPSFAWLYSAQYFLPAGERTGGDWTVEDRTWDSAGHGINGVSPIQDVQLQFDEARGSMSAKVTMRATPLGEDGWGALITELGDLPDLDGRMAELYIDEVEDDDVAAGRGRVLRGIIRGVSFVDVCEEGEEVGYGHSMNPAGTVSFMLHDLMSVLDTDLMKDDPILDDYSLGSALNIVISGSGAKAAERAGLDPDRGRTLSKAGPGEKPAVRPPRDAVRSQYALSLVDDFGMPAEELVAIDGVFTLQTRSTELLEIDGEVVDFRTDAGYTGRYRLESVVELPDDDSQLFNSFTVEGDIDPVTKKRISRQWVVFESLNHEDDPRYLGEPRWYKTVTDDAAKTIDDVDLRLRRLASENCRSKKFLQGGPKFIRQLRPDIRTLVNGREVEITRIPQNSMADDSMQFLVRRFVNL